MKVKKTNAMRHLDDLKLAYTPHDLNLKEAADAPQVAHLLGEPEEKIFKTLVAKANDKSLAVFMIPANAHLSLKKAAKAAGKKHMEMLPLKELLPNTGYVHGGCSPLGMKKQYPTFVDESVKDLDTLYFSGGKIGVQIEMNVPLFLEANLALPADLCE